MKQDLEIKSRFRENCLRCWRPLSHCYCALIKKIDSKIKFVILMHPLEAKRRIATGRMAHLCLSNSLLIRGADFTHHNQVNELIENPRHHCVVLYPGHGAVNLSQTPLFRQVPGGKEVVMFVIDGTWNTAKKTFRRSENLRKLPLVCFTPGAPSRFRVRRQPAAHCHSTIEAVHAVLRLCDGNHDKEKTDACDSLMTVFQSMVDQQSGFDSKAVRGAR